MINRRSVNRVVRGQLRRSLSMPSHIENGNTYPLSSLRPYPLPPPPNHLHQRYHPQVPGTPLTSTRNPPALLDSISNSLPHYMEFGRRLFFGGYRRRCSRNLTWAPNQTLGDGFGLGLGLGPEWMVGWMVGWFGWYYWVWGFQWYWS